MKLSYKQKLFLYFFVVFSIFTIGIIFFQQKRERTCEHSQECKTQAELLERKPDV